MGIIKVFPRVHMSMGFNSMLSRYARDQRPSRS